MYKVEVCKRIQENWDCRMRHETYPVSTQLGKFKGDRYAKIHRLKL